MADGHSTSVETLAALYASGLSLKHVGERAGMDQWAVWKLLKKAGVRMRTNTPRRYTLDEGFFEKVDTPLKAYVLGFAAADGSVRQCRQTFTWALARRDRQHLVNLAAALGSDAPVRDTPGTVGKDGATHPQSMLLLSSARFVGDMIRQGVGPNKTFTVVPPELPEGLEPSWWLGCIDGDGGFGLYHGKACELHFCGNREMVEGFRLFVARHTFCRSAMRPNKRIFTFAVQRIEDLHVLIPLLYRDSPLWLPRKRAIADAIMNVKPQHRDWRWLTAEILTDLRARLGSLCAVARHLGTNLAQIQNSFKRFGIPTSTTR